MTSRLNPAGPIRRRTTRTNWSRMTIIEKMVVAVPGAEIIRGIYSVARRKYAKATTTAAAPTIAIATRVAPIRASSAAPAE